MSSLPLPLLAPTRTLQVAGSELSIRHLILEDIPPGFLLGALLVSGLRFLIAGSSSEPISERSHLISVNWRVSHA
jgi:hypothetical protein